MTTNGRELEHGEWFLFRVFTPKGRFHLTVEADTWECAEELAKAIFAELKIEVTELRRAINQTGGTEESVNLLRARAGDDMSDEPWRGMRLYAGKNLWKIMGVGVMFEAEKIRQLGAGPSDER